MTADVRTRVEPAYLSAVNYKETLGGEVADICEMADYSPDPEQRLALDLIFALDRRGKSAHFETAVICSRQNLKTGLFKQAALGWLFLTEERLIVWSAHEFRTAQEAFRDMATLIEGCPMLDRRVKRVYRGNGDESIELLNGSRLIFKARTKSGGRGLTGDKVVLDEAFALQPDHMGALLPTLSVRPDPQVVYGSSAGLVTSDVLRGVRDRGRAGTSPRLAYIEWCAPPGGCADEKCTHRLGTEGCALDDVDNWQQANPLLGRTRSNGTGLTVEHVKAEREAMPPLEFARERLGWWDEPGTSEAFGPGKWEACFTTDVPTVPIGALAVAVSFDLSASAIVAAAVDGDRVFVVPLQHGPGTNWLPKRVRELQDEHRVDVVIDDHGPGADMVEPLENAGVYLKVAQTTDVLDACAGIYKLVQDGRVAHSAYPELDAAAAAAVRRDVGDRWAWGRKASSADISTLEAATLAVWSAERDSQSVYEGRGLTTL